LIRFINQSVRFDDYRRSAGLLWSAGPLAQGQGATPLKTGLPVSSANCSEFRLTQFYVMTNKKPSCRQSRPTVPAISEGQRPNSGRGKKAISQSNCSSIHAVVALLYRTLQSTPGYDTVVRRMWLTAAVKNFAFKIAVKPLQIA